MADLRRATINDVAVAAAVSRSTVSRALNGTGYVAAQVRERVLEAADRLGYVPNASAQHLRRQGSTAVGLLVPELGNSFYGQLATGVSEHARRSGLATILSVSGTEGEDEQPAQAFVELRVAGAIIAASSAEVGQYLARHGVPTVEVDRQFSEGATDAVVVDNVGGAHRLTSRLVDEGHRRIAILLDETHWTTGRDRYAGYRQALERAGIDVVPELVVSAGWDVQAAQRAATGLLSGPRPTAVFAANNLLAEGAWRAAADLGLRIPDDLSLVSFDDAGWMTMVSPGITTVAQDPLLVGRTAVDVLLERRADPAVPVRTVVVPAALVPRGSTAAPGPKEPAAVRR
ncbi:LacI family DNA-binding transcriptional regulator [Georgenia sp. H159]|uniref:LacI family DNA-binding transcriptional regulator n=1 Tax=Georgenia sp. H159 TaxID=3076115 RepID=UPI002D78E893|nr:LacI family DNA-binding transcriptional regulator [Georgenia sp. H159]